MRFTGNPFAMMIVATLLGCGGDHPEVGSVKGKVTLDGSPLAKAIVMFQPSPGRASNGTTDDQGNYSLDYLDGVKGALIGQHKVIIRTEIPGEDGQPPIQKEVLPKRYHDQTVLTAEVKAGSNTHDFTLESATSGKKK